MLTISKNGLVLESCEKTATGRVIVPNSIVKIRREAFKSCSHIEEIVLPEGLTTIDSEAFEGCSSLNKINIPSTLKIIPDSAFKGCVNLSTLSCHLGIVDIGSSAFQDCCSLASFPFSDAQLHIGYHAFYGCRLLQKVYVSKGLKTIDIKTFAKCESLTEIYLPENILEIKNEAFYGCSSLGKVVFANQHIRIIPTAFLECNCLTNLYVRKLDTSLIISAFTDCKNLNRIFIVTGQSISCIDKVVERQYIQQFHDNELSYASLYYHIIGLNITQMKWNDVKEIKSFKEPIDSDWREYTLKEQKLSDIINLNWKGSIGIGAALGYNNYRALDVDNCNIFYLDCLYPGRGLDAFIDDFLHTLGFPTDYAWVVKSGSGTGFHVIFKCDDIDATKDIDSISFQHNDKYGDGQNEIFDRIELRWCDHLVLPPSVHASGQKYYFRNNEFPSTKPQPISLKKIDELLYKYCGNRSFSTAMYNNIEFEYTELCKIISRHDSYLSPHEHQVDTLEWLTFINSEESRNSLALKYLLGIGVETFGDLAIDILKACSCQSAIYNLLQLYACGFVKCSWKDYQTLYKKLDISLFDGHLESLNVNAKNIIPKSELYLFFDTETTGLPRNYDAPSTDVDNWPRLVQLSWIVTDNYQNTISQHNVYVKPNGFTIPVEATKIHGITTQYATEEGINIKEALNMLRSDLENVDYVVGHNISFDEKIIEAECYRISQDIIDLFSFFPQETLCTMKSTVDFCKIPMKYSFGYKYPTLQELHKKLFGSTFSGVHNAFSDISATMKCFWELKRRGWKNKDFSCFSNEEDGLPFP